MPEIIIETTPAPIDISMTDLRAALSSVEPETKTAEPETKPAEVETVETKPETEPGTVEKKQEPEPIEEELPEGVKKRIAKEVEKTTRIQSEIDRAVSARKAKEEELKKLTGSEPAPITEKPSNGRPVRPKPDAYQTWGEYLAADDKYAAEYETWITSETRKTVEQQFSAAQRKTEDKRAWDTAVKDHAELPGMAEVVLAGAPEGLPIAISSLANWAGVTVHLGKHPEELAALAQTFQANPYAAVAELGKLEERLKPATKQAEPSKPLPAPLKPIGGTASATAAPVDMDNAPMSVFKAEVRRVTKPAG